MKTFFSFSVSFFSIRRPLIGTISGFLALFSTLLLGAHPAMAQTLGDMFCNSQVEISGLGDLFGACAYIFGIALLASGVLQLIRYADNSSSVPLHQPLTRIGGGAALISMPSVAGSVIDSLFTTPGGGGLTSCNVGAVASGAGLTGLDVLITNLVGNIRDPLTFLVSAIAIIAGIFFILRGLIKSARYGVDPRENSMNKILGNLVVGAALMVVGESLQYLLTSMFGTNTLNPATDVLGWNFVVQLNAGAQFTNAVMAALTFFQLIGLIAFVRGWLIMKRVSEGTGRETMAQGLTHMLGGVAAINIFAFLELMDATFGTNFLN